jgi:hypothetical protein
VKEFDDMEGMPLLVRSRGPVLYLVALVLSILLTGANASTQWTRLQDANGFATYSVYWTDDDLDNGLNVGILGGDVCIMTSTLPVSFSGNCYTVPFGTPVYCNINVRECMRQVTGRYGRPLTLTIPLGAIGQRICLGKFNGGRYFPWNYTSICIDSAPPVTCHITAPGPLRHDNIDVASVSGHTSTSTATLTCTGNKTVNVRAVLNSGNTTSKVPVRADGSISSHLKVNGVDGATGANVYAPANQPVTVTLSSTLSSDAPTPGALQGSAVLIMQE